MGFFLRVWYSFAIAVSVAASTWGSTRNVEFWTRVGILTAVFFATFSAAYAFQGADIQKAFRKKIIKASIAPEIKRITDNAVKLQIENSAKLESEVKVEQSADKTEALPSESNHQQKTSSTSMILQFLLRNFFQLLFSGTYVGSSFISRYFVLTTIWDLFKITARSSVFWGIFFASFLIKLIFDFTNEGFETNKSIAQRFNETRPFYARFLRPLSHETVIKSIRFAGSGDHTVVDDLLPWLGYIPEEAVNYLVENPPALIAVVTIGSVVGGLLAVLIFAQTFFYEGSRTEKNLNLLKLANQLKTMPKEDLPVFVGKTLAKTINIMAPLHGAASAMPVYFVAKELLTNSPAKWAVDIAVSLLVFLGVAIGVYYSEVTKAKDKILKRTPKAKEKIASSAIESNPLLEDKSSEKNYVTINPGTDANLSMTYFQ